MALGIVPGVGDGELKMAAIGQVTGRRYTRTRVRGNASWKPHAQTLALVDLVRGVVEEYEEPLTLRQVFYRLVGAHGYEKTEEAYARLGEYLNRARRAGMLSWDSFRDDGDIVPSRPGWANVQELMSTLQSVVENYCRTPEGEIYVEVWVETAGMVPQVETVADPFGVRVVASGGFSSTTARRNAAQRLNDELRSSVVLLIGDYDPSGQSIMDSTCEDVLAFSNASISFEPFAVTPKQAAKYNLVSAPQKERDKRGEWMSETYQAEALDPSTLAELVRSRLLELIGEDVLRRAAARLRRIVRRSCGSWDGSRDFTNVEN